MWLAVVCMMATCVSRGAGTSEWEVVKSEHFLVHHRAERAFAEQLAGAAEGYYRSISTDMGYTRHGGFWTWDKRVRITVHASAEEFARATGAPKWVAGRVKYASREIETFSGGTNFVTTVLPHELAHLIFREFVGFQGDIPLWIDEGVAQWQEPAYRHRVQDLAKKLMQQNRLLPLDELIGMDKRKLEGRRQAGDFYVESASLVGFLVERRGNERFTVLCRHLRDGRTVNEALRFTYGDGMRTIEELEEAWRKYLASEMLKQP